MAINQRKRVAMASSTFPVDEGLLPRLSISPAQHEELRRYALQAAQVAIRDGPTWGRSNIKDAISCGWKVLSARPTACFMMKEQAKKKKSPSTPKRQSEQLPKDKTRQTSLSATRFSIPSLGSFHASTSSSKLERSASSLQETTSGLHFMAHAVLPNSLEDVMNRLYCEQTHEMRAQKQRFYGQAVLDCCVLQTLEGATLEDPFWYLGLKWLAVRSPMPTLSTNREFVFLEHLGTFVDPETGHRMLYRVAQSVHIRGYGGQDSYFGLTRGHIEAAFVYWMDDDNEERNPLLHVCAKGRCHMKGSIPDALVYKFFKSLWRSEHTLFPTNRSSFGMNVSGDEHVVNEIAKKKKKKRSKRHKIPAGPPLEMAYEWVTDELRPRCSVCNKKFRLVQRSKHHCRACGEVMCRACTFHYLVNVRDAQSFRGVRPTVRGLDSDLKRTHEKELPFHFDETMTCSFDGQLEMADEKEEEFDTVHAKRPGSKSTEMAVLGGNMVVCVAMAKVCLRCLQSVPLGKDSTLRRRHSEVVRTEAFYRSDTAIGWREELPQVGRPPNREVEELDGSSRYFKREHDVPMLVMEDEDTDSIDELADSKRRSGSCAIDGRLKSFNFDYPGHTNQYLGPEDGTLDSLTNRERVIILSPHALLKSTSLPMTQRQDFKEESSYGSSGCSESYQSQYGSDAWSDSDDNNKQSIEFCPTRALREELTFEDSQGRLPNCAENEVNSFLKSKNFQHAASAASSTERRLCHLHEEELYQTRHVPSPSVSTTSLFSEDEDSCSEMDDRWKTMSVIKRF
ncbi:hypothetical protein CCR75_009377 [Bremia lactucae]|uniref:FYVE-type domain-containing protein n=1 Tax=Bremia lactucae TaxID=4779 RepID=A0A976FM78_BRELC|nr:hypothetical protein CCR75_009377 [Bremia lactucae]